MKQLKIFLPALLIVMYFSFSGFFGSSAPKTENYILQIGDTSHVFDVFGATSVVVTVVDSSNSLNDTIYVQTRGGDTTSSVAFYWSTIAIHNVGIAAQTTFLTNTCDGVASDGTTRTYALAPFDVYTQIRVLRSNESTNDLYAPRTKISVKSK